MRSTTWVIGFFCLVGFVCSNDENSEDVDQIVGGSPAAAGEFPYMATLNLAGRLCGGTLIKPNVVLTASHCLAGLPVSSTSKFRVIVNTLSLSGGTGAVTRTVRKFLMHSGYNSNTMNNDVALLALSSPIDNIKLATLPTSNSSLYAGQSAVVAGWGTTSAGGSISTKLLKATVTVLDNATCNKQYGDININKICAAAPGKDTCQGDSGGPLFVGGVQVGVTSYGIGCANPKYAGVYARVTTYLNWIATNAASI